LWLCRRSIGVNFQLLGTITLGAETIVTVNATVAAFAAFTTEDAPAVVADDVIELLDFMLARFANRLAPAINRSWPERLTIFSEALGWRCESPSG
jgi:hypothetical protein